MQLIENLIAIVLAGGQGSRLSPLTEKRSKPAVPIAGKFRLIDVPMSNCLHSGIRKMFVLTQFASESLHRHLTQTYPFPPWSNGFAQILAAQQTLSNSNWYQGTADAVRQNLIYLRNKDFEYFIILSGDHLYRMNYRHMLETHQAQNADVTVSVLPISKENADQFGVLKTDNKGKIVSFYEKPDSPELLKLFAPNMQWVKAQGYSGSTDCMLASMGIYIFSRKALFEMLEESNESDFGKGIFPQAIKKYNVVAHYFDDYWEDIGTIKSFYDAMIDLTKPEPKFNFYEENKPIYTHARFLPGAQIDDCNITQSLICDAARLDHSEISGSIVGVRSVVKKGCKLRGVVLMGADFMEMEGELKDNDSNGLPPVGIGEKTVIEKAIIDKNARIGKNVKMLAAGRSNEKTDMNYSIRDGILIVPKDAVIEDGAVIS
ncbi:MAG: glucose-1-phosphate adenylyltransferase [Calditrichaeota bacterium]|nr:MAG: glucose-1-phosphate adenylyltransferase [Calditrichota bacterium]